MNLTKASLGWVLPDNNNEDTIVVVEIYGSLVSRLHLYIRIFHYLLSNQC